MTTLSSKTIHLAVYGFIRRIQSSTDILDVIKDLILEFAKNHFEWEQSKYTETYSNSAKKIQLDLLNMVQETGVG